MAHPVEPALGGDRNGSPPVLLLHGQPGGSADWAGVAAALGPAAASIAFDRPGWDGHSRATDLEGNARAALDRLDAAGAAEAIVVGHSLGGAIAAWLAATRPERVRALVLAAPAANAASLYRVDRWLAAPLLGELAASVTLGGLGLTLALPAARAWLARLTGVDSAYLARTAAMIRRPGAWWSYSAEQRALVRDVGELERRLGAIRAPTTVLAGSADRIVAPGATRRLVEQIPGARLQMIEDAGHLLPQTRPFEIAAAIRALAARPERG
jgi:pimeloyl-ACP methyl ester carboxylesterase